MIAFILLELLSDLNSVNNLANHNRLTILTMLRIQIYDSSNILRELGEITEFHTVFNANFAMKAVLNTIYQYNRYKY